MQEQVQEGQAELFSVENYEAPQKEPISEDMLQDVALNAIGKIPMQDFINDAVQALVEIYKMKPDIFQLDVDNYDIYPPYLSNPFMDLVSYLQELNRETGTSNGAG